MTLSEYLAETKATEAEIARRTGLSQPTINRIRNGVGNPTIDVLKRIAEATEGRVTPNEFIGIPSLSHAAGDAA